MLLFFHARENQKDRIVSTISLAIIIHIHEVKWKMLRGLRNPRRFCGSSISWIDDYCDVIQCLKSSIMSWERHKEARSDREKSQFSSKVPIHESEIEQTQRDPVLLRRVVPTAT